MTSTMNALVLLAFMLLILLARIPIFLGKRIAHPNVPLERVQNPALPAKRPLFYNASSDIEKTVNYWYKHPYSVPTICKPYMKPKGYLISLLARCVSFVTSSDVESSDVCIIDIALLIRHPALHTLPGVFGP